MAFIKAIDVLTQAGLEFEPVAFVLQTDERGVATKADELSMKDVLARDLLRSGPGKCVQLTCNDERLSLTCTFGSPHATQVFSIAVGRKRWLEQTEELRSEYEYTLTRVANESAASSILIVDDPPDDFLGNIQPVNSQWLVDLRLLDGTTLDSLVLSKGTIGVVLAEGDLCATDRSVHDFTEYEPCG